MYDPWLDLDERHPGIRVVFSGDLPEDTLGEWDGQTLRLREDLTEAEVRSTLAHEIAHIDRGIAGPDCSIEDEEALVEDLASRRLIASEDLASAVANAINYGMDRIADDLLVDRQTAVNRIANLSRIEISQVATKVVGNIVAYSRANLDIGREIADRPA